MTGSRLRTGSSVRPPVGHELHLVLEAHGHLLALTTVVIERMLLAEEARPIPVVGGTVIESGGHAWPTWNLGHLLGLPPLRTAWVLMQVPHATGGVRVALETGRCIVVRPITRLATLPRGIFRERPGALAGAFDAGQGERTGGANVGLVIDPARLFTDAEIESTRARILTHINASGSSRP